MGKASLIMVVGFSTVLLMIGSNVSKVSTASLDNYLHYYESSMAHYIAAAGTNLAARSLWENGSWRGGFANKPLNGGHFSSQVSDAGSNQVKITTRATFMEETSVITVLLQRSTFSRFGYYSVQEGNIFWITGDTVWGPMHTQDNIRVSGSPVFMQRTTSLKGLQKNDKKDSPKFLGGYESGVNVVLPSDLTSLRTAGNNGGKVFTGPDSVYLEFMSNGQVKWKQGVSGTVYIDNLTTLAPNGVIYADGANIHVKGVVNGKVTVCAGGPTSNNKQGNIIIDDDITYYEHPKKGTDDILGLVAENNVLIADNVATRGNLNIHASVLCRSGGFTAENHKYRPIEGTINLIGGIQHDKRGPVGTFSGSPPHRVSGYLKNYKYDDRLLYDAPPYFPTTGNYEIVSWLE